MSIERCEKHGLNWDTDYLEECPECLDEDLKYDCKFCEDNGCYHCHPEFLADKRKAAAMNESEQLPKEI